MVLEIAGDPQFEGQFRPLETAPFVPAAAPGGKDRTPEPPLPVEPGPEQLSSPLGRQRETSAERLRHLQEMESFSQRLDAFDAAIRQVCSGVQQFAAMPVLPPPLETAASFRKPAPAGKINSLLKWLWS